MFRLKRISAAALLAVLAIVLGSVSALAEPLKLTIVHVNDWDRLDGERGAGGAARIATIVKDERERNDGEGGLTLVTFGGDMLSPSLLSGIDKGRHMIELSNAIGFSVAVLGNHEFDFGPDILMQRLSEATFPWLAGNLEYKGKPGLPGTKRSVMIEKNGYKIGIFGMLTPATREISSPGDDVVFRSFGETATELAGQLKKDGADIVIALTHEDFRDDLALLLKNSDIDMIFGGHDHLAINWYDGRKMLMKAGSQGSFVGVVEIAVDRIKGRNGPRIVWSPSFNLVNTTDVEPDPEMQAKVQGYLDFLDKQLGTVIGETSLELDTRRASVRTMETAFGNLLADAMRKATGADVAITNGGGIRGDTLYPANTELTRKDVLTELPFGNTTVVLEVSGSALLAALENSVSGVERAKGRFPQVSGLVFAYDPKKAVGGRIVDVKVAGKPLAPDTLYKLATNDFMARGGDGYSAFASAKILVNAKAATLMASQLIDHIVSIGKVSTGIEGRIARIE